MIVRSIEDVRAAGREASTRHWSSARLLVRDDGMGFTMTDTVLEPGMDERLWYKHHLEACYCVEGHATVEDLATGERHEIRPGVLYALDRNDRHRIVAHERTRLICVFTPALTGREVHDAEGAYTLPDA
jgi:L-ectoine synthase